jgi:hypothetical protein
MSKRKKGARVPGMSAPAKRPVLYRGTWEHFTDIAARKGWKLTEGERIAAVLATPDPEWEGWKREHKATLKLHCSRCGNRLRNRDGYLVEAHVDVFCERCSQR